MYILQICPPHLSDVAILPWEIQKVISTVLFIYTSNRKQPLQIRLLTEYKMGKRQTATYVLVCWSVDCLPMTQCRRQLPLMISSSAIKTHTSACNISPQ